MNQISIAEPCHENWAAMSPTEQGAFCGKCKIDVIDFSNKSPNEIKSILEKSAGKHLCGRFDKNQLNDLNLTYAEWHTQDIRTFQSKFLYALLLVFGMSIFNCNATEKEFIENQFALNSYELFEQKSQTNPDSLNHKNEKPIKPEPVKKPQNYKMGKVAYNPKPDTTKKCDTNTTIPINNKAIEEERFVKGEIIYTAPDTLVKKHNNIQTDTIKSTNSDQQLIIIENDYEIKLFPNPTDDRLTLTIQIKNQAYFTISIFDINGKLMEHLFSGHLFEGNQQFEAAINHYPTGTYIVSVTANRAAQTLKFVKQN